MKKEIDNRSNIYYLACATMQKLFIAKLSNWDKDVDLEEANLKMKRAVIKQINASCMAS